MEVDFVVEELYGAPAAAIGPGNALTPMLTLVLSTFTTRLWRPSRVKYKYENDSLRLKSTERLLGCAVRTSNLRS